MSSTAKGSNGSRRIACVARAIAFAARGAESDQVTTHMPEKRLENEVMQTSKRTGDMPDIRALTSSPLRNRIRVHLDAPASDVWALLGDFAKFPEYSSGLERVESKVDATGKHTEFICHFKPLEPGGEPIVSREIVRWWEPNRGYASSGAGGDAFGMTNDLNLVVLEPSAAGTIVTMDEYYEAQDLQMMKAHFDEAFADIGANLVRRFGGKIVERYVQK